MNLHMGLKEAEQNRGRMEHQCGQLRRREFGHWNCEISNITAFLNTFRAPQYDELGTKIKTMGRNVSFFTTAKCCLKAPKSLYYKP